MVVDQTNRKLNIKSMMRKDNEEKIENQLIWRVSECVASEGSGERDDCTFDGTSIRFPVFFFLFHSLEMKIWKSINRLSDRF